MEKFSNDKRIQKIQLENNLELYVNIRNDAERDIDIFFDLQSQSENNRSITIELNNFKDKNGEDIRVNIIGIESENGENSKSYKFTIDKTEVIKMQFSRKSLIKNNDFNEINFDIVIDENIYSFIWNYPNKILIRK